MIIVAFLFGKFVGLHVGGLIRLLGLLCVPRASAIERSDACSRARVCVVHGGPTSAHRRPAGDASGHWMSAVRILGVVTYRPGPKAAA